MNDPNRKKNVRQIRKRIAAGELYRPIAADKGVTRQTISAINRGLYWSFVR